MAERTFETYLPAIQAVFIAETAKQRGQTADAVLLEAISHGLAQMGHKPEPAKRGRKRRPKVDMDKVHPARIVDLGPLQTDIEGYLHAILLVPEVPPSQVVAIGHACARAILGVLEWPDDKAAAMAERVREWLADELRTAMAPGPDEPVPPELQKMKWDEPGGDLDDDLPF